MHTCHWELGVKIENATARGQSRTRTRCSPICDNMHSVASFNSNDGQQNWMIRVRYRAGAHMFWCNLCGVQCTATVWRRLLASVAWLNTVQITCALCQWTVLFVWILLWISISTAFIATAHTVQRSLVEVDFHRVPVANCVRDTVVSFPFCFLGVNKPDREIVYRCIDIEISPIYFDDLRIGETQTMALLLVLNIVLAIHGK